MKKSTKRIQAIFVLCCALALGVGCASPSASVSRLPLIDNWKIAQAKESTRQHQSLPAVIYPQDIASVSDSASRQSTFTTTWNFTKPQLRSEHISLVIDGSIGYGVVYLNSKRVGELYSAFKQYRFDIASAVKVGQNTVEVQFASGQNAQVRVPFYLESLGKPRLNIQGLDTQVYIEMWDKVRAQNVHHIQQSLSSKQAGMKTRAKVEVSRPTTVDLEVWVNGDKLGNSSTELPAGKHTVEASYMVNEPKLWWPKGHGEQPLYTFTTVVKADGKADTLRHTYGFRTIEIASDKQGTPTELTVNGKRIFIKGARFVPNFPLHTSKLDYGKLAEATTQAHLNLLWSWGGGNYPSQAFYEACDRNGIMVWQDIMGVNNLGNNPSWQKSAQEEATERVQSLVNHPSIILWSLNTSHNKEKSKTDAEFIQGVQKLLTETDGNRHVMSPNSDSDLPYEPMVTLGSIQPTFDTTMDSAFLANWQDKQIRALRYPSRDTVTKPSYRQEVQHVQAVQQVVQTSRVKDKMGVIASSVHMPFVGNSSATLDDKGRWKAAHYMLKKSAAPLVLVPHLGGDMLSLHVVSELPNAIEVNSELTFIAMNESLENVALPMHYTIQPQSVTQVYHQKLPSQILQHLDQYMLYVNARKVDDASNVLVENTMALSKQPKWRKAGFITQMKATQQGYDILLISLAYARQLALSFGVEGEFSDNFFDMVPNRVYKIKFKTRVKGLTKNDLQINSVNSMEE